LLAKGPPTAIIICNYLAFKGAPNSNFNVQVPCFQRVLSSNFEMQVPCFQSDPTTISNEEIKKSFKPTSIRKNCGLKFLPKSSEKPLSNKSI